MSEQPIRVPWRVARADSPVHAAWREGKVPDAVNEWLWIVAPVPFSEDGRWPVIAFRIYAGFGASFALNSGALDTVEDWQPVIPGTPKGDKCLDLVWREAPRIRRIDPEHEAKYFMLSSKEPADA